MRIWLSCWTSLNPLLDNSHENVPLKGSHLEKDEDMALLLDIFEPQLLDNSHENVPLKDSHLEKDEDMALLLDILEPLLQTLLQGSHHIPVIPGRGHNSHVNVPLRLTFCLDHMTSAE
jgi:hypothetical protein